MALITDESQIDEIESSEAEKTVDGRNLEELDFTFYIDTNYSVIQLNRKERLPYDPWDLYSTRASAVLASIDKVEIKMRELNHQLMKLASRLSKLESDESITMRIR